MASSNKNWPSMFRSKPCSNHHHHHHHHNRHDIDTPSFMHYSSCHSSSPFTSERVVPQPKPRWNPKPEQIQILESIFNSGMINPPRDEIKNIRIRLQEYGQVGDANVFYWFQNRKSRTKHKLRLLQQNLLPTSGSNHNKPNNSNNISPTLACGASSSFGPVYQRPGSFPVQDNAFLIAEPAGFLLPVHDDPSATQEGFGCSDHQLNDVVVVPAETEDVYRFENNALEIGIGFSDVNYNGVNSKIEEHVEQEASVKILGPEIPLSGIVPGVVSSHDDTVPLIINQIPDERFGASAARSTVFINDMPFQVAVGLFNVREAFGNDAVLINSSGHPILTDDLGFTLHPLQNGAVYYLI